MCRMLITSIWLFIFLLSFPNVIKALLQSDSDEIEDNTIPAVRQIHDCISMGMDEGAYELRSQGSSHTCALYLSTDPHKRIKLTFQYADVNCEQGGLVAVVDGWELNGHFFPSSHDHAQPLSQRVHEFCGNRRPLHHYLASQNAMMIQYRVPENDQGFHVTVEFIDNLTPCNVLLQGIEASFTSSNYGQRINCSITALFPSHVDVLSLHVGPSIMPIQTKCPERGSEDYVEVLGSTHLTSSTDSSFITLCGSHTAGKSVGDLFANVLCPTTTIRMRSSGRYDNRLQLHFRSLLDDDMAHFTCQIQ
ncbi:hypothetical protein CHUAL_010486 [Chamberlinius hualienensis]